MRRQIMAAFDADR